MGAVDLGHPALRAHIERLFRAPDGPLLVGLEAEVVPVDRGGRPLPIEPDPATPDRPATASLLSRLASDLGWCPVTSVVGSPGWRVPGGGTLSFEPGGQLEYSSPPMAGIDRLLAHVESVFEPIGTRAEAEGVVLMARGIDPRTPVEHAPLRLAGERYRRMADHYDRRGAAGRRMMRQTAALHLNVDAAGDPRTAWRVANALAPVLIAVFANSPRAAGAETGHRSFRAAQWRELDPTRTGVRPRVDDAVGDYLAFALDAEAFLVGSPGRPAAPFGAWPPGALGLEHWNVHLSTLFPEVRPRGYLELRSVDALPLAWYGAPLALVAGVLQDPETLREALHALPPADHDTLVRAGRDGLADPDIAERAQRALDLAAAGLTRLEGAERAAGVLEGYRTRFTARGLDHGHATTDGLTGP